MPESRHPKAHICHLTVLNPALHSRIFYKEARSQAAAGYRVTIVGQDEAKAPYTKEGIHIVPTGVFSRLGTQRLRARKAILELARAEQADLYLLHSPELLGVGKKLKAERPQTKLIYDVHEDYKLNIRYTSAYPLLLRNWVARRLIRAEKGFAEYGDGLLYAEHCYRDIADLPADRIAYVLNKFQAPPRSAAPIELAEPQQPLMLYTGTIAPAWGIFRAIKLWELLNHRLPVNLLVAGHTHDTKHMRRITRQVARSGFDYRFSMFRGGDYVPYDNIVDLIRQCTIGVALYEQLPHIREKIPTKFYEFMACRKPLLFTDNHRWQTLNDAHDFGMGMAWPPETQQVDRLADWLRRRDRPFYTKPIGPEDYGWEAEAQKMLALIARVLA